jgi:hypothetical protein
MAARLYFELDAIGALVMLFARRHHGFRVNALGGDVEGSDGQEKPEAREGAEIANLRLLEIPPIGLVVKERLYPAGS